MGNLANSIKKFTSNKNTVTVLGVILAIIVLYVAYIMRVNASISPISVPYAKEQISPGSQITSDLIGTRDVPPAMLKGDVLRSVNQVQNKYASANSVIPAGSLFYESTVVEKEQVPTNVILEYPSGYVLYNMEVTTATTYGNSIYPGNYIDIYLKARTKEMQGVTTNDKKLVLGRLIENIQVIAVKDAQGQPVFQDLEENRVPALVVFAVPEEYFILLKKAEYLRTYESELIPVPTNESLKNEPGQLNISSESLKKWINDVTVWTAS